MGLVGLRILNDSADLYTFVVAEHREKPIVGGDGKNEQRKKDGGKRKAYQLRNEREKKKN